MTVLFVVQHISDSIMIATLTIAQSLRNIRYKLFTIILPVFAIQQLISISLAAFGHEAFFKAVVINSLCDEITRSCFTDFSRLEFVLLAGKHSLIVSYSRPGHTFF